MGPQDSPDRRHCRRSQERMTSPFVPKDLSPVVSGEAAARRSQQAIGRAVDPENRTPSTNPPGDVSVGGNRRNVPVCSQSNRGTEREAENGAWLKFPVRKGCLLERDAAAERKGGRCERCGPPRGSRCEEVRCDAGQTHTGQTLDDVIDVGRSTPPFVKDEYRPVTHERRRRRRWPREANPGSGCPRRHTPGRHP